MVGFLKHKYRNIEHKTVLPLSCLGDTTQCKTALEKYKTLASLPFLLTTPKC